MNKSNVRQKRTLGKDSPLSKRPKLDFTLKSKEPFNDNKFISKEGSKDNNERLKEKVSSAIVRKNIQDNTSTTSDWDEDFSGDMLEKVCLIADLSQAMVNNQSVPKDFDKEKVDFEIFENNHVKSKTKLPNSPLESSGSGYESLKLELERLQERLKNKEGEVHILRSQLKQSEDAKQTVALQNVKVVEEIQKKFNEKIYLTEKELESTKSKLLFKDLEYKTLSERCRQLECNISKGKLNEVNSTKSFFMSQVGQNNPTKEVNENKPNFVTEKPEKNLINLNFEFPIESFHEGKCLTKLICPEFFKLTNEASVIDFCSNHTDIDSPRGGVDLDKKEKYKWNNLPKQTVFIKDLFNSVSSLFTYNSFIQKEAQKIVQTLTCSCMEILTHLKQVLSFLEGLQLSSDYDKADQLLLENEEEIQTVTIKNLIDGEKLREEECGIEGRRCLALLYALMATSKFAFRTLCNNLSFLELLKNLATAIGTLRRPLSYNGILIGITFILQKVLEEKDLTKDSLALINETVEEIIFARPKLDVLMEVVNVLATGKLHFEFLSALCRKDSVDSCTLYMDCKLKQAMFFTKSTCPLKLLCMQIMGLACLSSSRILRWEVTNCIIKWLNSSINTPFFKKIKWLPINPMLRQERCFNVTECLLYLLTLCIKDYIEISSQDKGLHEKSEMEKKKIIWISIIGEGAVLLKRILKADQGHLNDNNYCLRFAMLASLLNKSDHCQKTHISCMNSLQAEAFSWITDLLESDLRNQDCCLKQNTSAISDIDFFETLKISDGPKIN